MHDALTFSKNNYYGTARSIGMGNAMTAVGGDLGSIGINPAGSAVAGYSQFTITPNLTVSVLNSSYSAYPDANGNDTFLNERNNTLTRFSMPNIGTTFNFNTGRSYGLKSVTYGFTFNGTNNFTDKMMAGGINNKSSYIGSIASWATRDAWHIDYLNGFMDKDGNRTDSKGNKFDVWDNAYYDGRASWNQIVNAQAGAIAVFGDEKEPDYPFRYIGATELYKDKGEVDEKGNHLYNIFLGGPLDQTYGRRVTGSKYDALLNAGFNFNDVFYLGVNLGITGLNYNFDEYFKEFAQDPADFPIGGDVNFDNYRTRYSYTADGTGVYGKIGFIAKPFEGLRIGAAVQTPTWMNINESWKHAVDIHYKGASAKDGNATTPEGKYEYELRSPYRMNAGIAYTFMGMGLVSLDYEMTDYATMKFSSKEYADDTFRQVNDDIADCMGISHMLRLGAEFKPAPEFAVRAGYNFATVPVKENGRTTRDKTNVFSVGLGYSSSGSFFTDLSARFSSLSDEYVSPYSYPAEDKMDALLILNKRNLWDISATIGFR